MRADTRIRLNLLDSMSVRLAWKSVMEMLEAITAGHIVFEFRSVAIEHLLRLKKFGLASEYLKHIATARPAHKIEVNFSKHGLHPSSAVSDVRPHFMLCSARPRRMEPV